MDGLMAAPFALDAGRLLPIPGRLERFQEKWIPLFHLENATTQGLRAFVPMQSGREMLQGSASRSGRRLTGSR
jgi:hypothetical protein